MAPTAASVASLAEGLARVPRPISAAPMQSAGAIAQNATPRVWESTTRSIESGLSRAARPYPYTAVSQATGLERAGMGRAANAANGVLIDLERKEAAALSRQFTVNVVQRQAAAAVRPAATAAAEVGGVLKRVPLVGKVLQRVAPIAGPLLVVSALQSIPSVFEFFAPGVHDWLLGGWRGDGKGKGTISYPANSIGQGNGAWYLLSFVIQSTTPEGGVHPQSRSHYPGGSPIRMMGPVTVRFGLGAVFYSQLYQRNLQAIDPSWTDRFGLTYTGMSYFLDTPDNFITWSLVREDGTNENQPDYAHPTTTAAAITQNPTKVAPSQTPKSPAEGATNAALAAVAATIAAGKLKLSPPNAKKIADNQQKKFGTALEPSPTETAPATNPCKGNACGGANLDATKGNADKLDALLAALNALGIGDIKKTVDKIDQKVGPQIYDDRGNKIGIAGHALKMFEKLNKVGDYLRFDRITNVLTLAATVHNAAMLSNQLEQTLAQALSSALAVIGIKDSEGNQLDINKIVGKSVENTIKGAIGAQNYTELTTNWKKANRIYQAGANLINNVQSLRYSITGALETIASMNGKVANALKKYGVLGDNAYPWMNPSPNFDNKFMRGLETAENAVSSIDSIASEVLSAQETVTEIGKQKTELEKAIKDGTEKPGVNNTQQKEKATAAKTASKSPDIVADNLIKPES
jgi:hypothetical protein